MQHSDHTIVGRFGRISIRTIDSLDPVSGSDLKATVFDIIPRVLTVYQIGRRFQLDSVGSVSGNSQRHTFTDLAGNRIAAIACTELDRQRPLDLAALVRDRVDDFHRVVSTFYRFPPIFGPHPYNTITACNCCAVNVMTIEIKCNAGNFSHSLYTFGQGHISQ